METRLSGQDVALDPPAGDEGETMTPIAYLTDSEAEPAQILERAETARNRSRGLQERPVEARRPQPRQSSRRAGCAKTTIRRRCRTLADKYGVSAERIRQIESKALKTMRGQMSAAAISLRNANSR